MYSPIRQGMPLAANISGPAAPPNISAVKIDIIEPTASQYPKGSYPSVAQNPASQIYNYPNNPVYNMQQGSMYGQPSMAPQYMQQGLMYGQPQITPQYMQQGVMNGQPQVASQYNIPQTPTNVLPVQQMDPQLKQTLEMLQKQMGAVQDKMNSLAATVPMATQQQVPPAIPNVVGPTLIQSGPQIVPAQPQAVTPPPIPTIAEPQVSATPQVAPPVPTPTPIIQEPVTAESQSQAATPPTNQVVAPETIMPAPTPITQDVQLQPVDQQAVQVDESSKVDDTMNVDKIVGLLTSEDADEKTVGIQKIAELGQVKSKESEALLNEKVFKALHDIITKDTNPKPGETPDQKDVREKDHVNKMIGMWTLAILQKNFRKSMNEEAKKQGIPNLSIKELPELVSIVNCAKNDADPTIRAAALSSLKYLGTPAEGDSEMLSKEDHDSLATIFEIALAQDINPGVKITAIDALMTIAQPQDVQKYLKLFNSEMVNADSTLKSTKDPDTQRALSTLKETAQKAIDVLAGSVVPQQQIAQNSVNPQQQGQEDFKIPAYRPDQVAAQ